jgi:triacylglycerol lipase
MNILLVHGFGNTGRVFRRLENRLTAAGHKCFTPTLAPRDGRLGLTDLARKLAAYVDGQMADAGPFVIVGFSMGCLVARCYLQQLHGVRQARAFFAISGPMRGTATAFLYPGQGARDMRYGSRFLRELDATAGTLDGLPLHIYYTPFDLMIIPATSSRLKGARETLVRSPLHRWMLTDPVMTDDLLQKLRQLES